MQFSADRSISLRRVVARQWGKVSAGFFSRETRLVRLIKHSFFTLLGISFKWRWRGYDTKCFIS